MALDNCWHSLIIDMLVILIIMCSKHVGTTIEWQDSSPNPDSRSNPAPDVFINLEDTGLRAMLTAYMYSTLY